MVEIVENDINLTRGDTLNLKVNMEDENGTEYIPGENDEIRFAMKKRYKDSECLIKKQISPLTRLLRLDPEDTKGLPFGRDYVYDIQITKEDGTVDTFISGVLHLVEEVD